MNGSPTPGRGRNYVVGVDIGGTFTDLVLADGHGIVDVRKRLTDHVEPDRGVVEAVREALEANGVAPGALTRVVHGTTLATNTVLERTGPPIAVVATEGFGDLLHLSREARVEEDRYDLFFTLAEPPLPRSMVFEARERLDASGEVVTPFDLEHFRGVAARIAAREPEAVAVCLLHSYRNPIHEHEVGRVLAEMVPGARVVLSSDVLPEMREYDRATTTLVSAYVAPVMAGYLQRLEDRLRDLGVQAPLQIMESSGGVMSAAVAAARAVATIESGGAAGVIAAAHVARRHRIERALSFDMGGTTAKAGVVVDGEPVLTRDLHVGGKGSYGGRRSGTGLLVRIPVIDLAEVGVGGGSIAWLDVDHVLHVGPRSAGSSPGPACYGGGGTEPTVTDANLLLGYLDPSRFAGGAMALDRDAAEQAMRERVADPLGVDVTAAAWAVHELVNANMASAIHVVTVQRGLDPRDHLPIAFGGAGPMHVAGVVDHFGIDEFLAPDGAGVTSSIGMLAADAVAERAVTFVTTLAAIGGPDGASVVAEIDRRFAALVASAVEQMGLAGTPDTLDVTYAVDARFAGQTHALVVTLAGAPDAATLGEVGERFVDEFAARFGIRRAAPVELTALRVRLRLPVASSGAEAAVAPDPRPLAERAGRGTRPAYFGAASADTFVDAAVYERSALAPGDVLHGPAVVDGAVDTIVVPPGWTVTVDDHRGVRARRAR